MRFTVSAPNVGAEVAFYNFESARKLVAISIFKMCFYNCYLLLNVCERMKYSPSLGRKFKVDWSSLLLCQQTQSGQRCYLAYHAETKERRQLGKEEESAHQSG